MSTTDDYKARVKAALAPLVARADANPIAVLDLRSELDALIYAINETTDPNIALHQARLDSNVLAPKGMVSPKVLR